MGSGCQKLISQGQLEVQEPILRVNLPQRVKKSQVINSQQVILEQSETNHLNENQENQNRLMKFQIGPYLFQTRQQEKIFEAIQMERWLVILEQGSKFKKECQFTYFQSETQKCLYLYQKFDQKGLLQFLQNYVPNKIRWNLWKAVLFPEHEYDPNLYALLQKQQIKEYQLYNIKKDIHRTFPQFEYFKNLEENDSKLRYGQKSLFRVLKAVNLYFPAVGYTQGMNYIVGFLLLLNGGKEQEAFWSFVFMGKNDLFYILGFFEDGFPLLYFYIYIFFELLKKQSRKLYDHINSLSLPNESWIFQWISTLLLYSFPLDYVVKIWDIIFSKNLFYMIQICVSILVQFEKYILTIDGVDFLDFFKQIKNDPEFYQQNYQTLIDALKLSKKIELSINQIKNYAYNFEQIQKEKETYLKIKQNHYYTQYYKQYLKQDNKNAFLESLIPSQNQNNIDKQY